LYVFLKIFTANELTGRAALRNKNSPSIIHSYSGQWRLPSINFATVIIKFQWKFENHSACQTVMCRDRTSKIKYGSNGFVSWFFLFMDGLLRVHKIKKVPLLGFTGFDFGRWELGVGSLEFALPALM
jgi:hypothetical protein